MTQGRLTRRDVNESFALAERERELARQHAPKCPLCGEPMIGLVGHIYLAGQRTAVCVECFRATAEALGVEL